MVSALVPGSSPDCSEDSGFSLRSEEMCDFFDKRGHPASNKLIGSPHYRRHPAQKDLTLTPKEARKATKL